MTTKESHTLALHTNKRAEVIILAGGLGTRLRTAVPDLPKCMAPVAGRPFLSHVIDYFRMQGIQQFIFSLGYKAEVITDYLKEFYPTLQYRCVIEDEPLGTGGAIQLACQAATAENVLVANGDTLFKINYKTLAAFHQQHHAECTIALKPMKNFERYGVVVLDKNESIESFQEKKFYAEGLINGGIYLINREKFIARSLPQKFSFEKDYLEMQAAKGNLFGCVQDSYFIDIGIPGDFQQAQSDLQKPKLDLSAVDKSWTLFLDRDGVINLERFGKYVLHWGEFEFLEGVQDALKFFAEKFDRVIIISNQRGVGKKLMTEADLKDIHQKMQKEVEASGGRIDAIYYCLEVADDCFYRKPNPGMALQALSDFPDIDFSRSIMVGNKPSDMRFGRAAGMFTVFVTTTNPHQPFPHEDIDLRFDSLHQFAQALILG